MQNEKFVLGVDFGTDSVRSILVDAGNGREIASSIFHYPRWRDGMYCNPSQSQFRQHPLDYIEGLESSIRICLREAGPAAARKVAALSVDTTGSSPVAVDETGTPLGMLPGFEHNPNALFVLWKDHTAIQEAAEINAHAEKFTPNYLQYVGGIYSSEWFWAKLLHVLREDPAVRKACYSWVEHCDWIPFLLTGGSLVAEMKRGVCSAGHKALWAPEFGGLPPDNFFSTLDPLLKGFTSRLFTDTHTADRPAGRISPAWAQRLGLPEATLIGVGAFDAHMGAVGGQIEPYHLSKVMGTSTCDMLVAPADEMKGRLVKGICGQVPGSVIPGMIGLEAGQSAFGDAYAWLRNVLSWPLRHTLPLAVGKNQQTTSPISDATVIDRAIDMMIPELSRQASGLTIEAHDDTELALDWLNGRRTPDANQLLKGAIIGLNLGSDAPRIFRSIVESTCFGAKAIVDRFMEEGIPVKGLIGLGGVARKSPFIMQMMADVMNRPIRIHRSEQTCALGASMFAATAAGIYPKVEEAMAAMGQGFEFTYSPDPSRASLFARRFQRYRELGNYIESSTAKTE